MRFIGLLTAAALIASSTASFADAVLRAPGAGVIASQGKGFSDVGQGAKLGPGTRLMVKRAVEGQAGDATLKFVDGCEISLAPGQVFTIGAQSPCTFNAQAEPGLGLSAPLVVGGIVVAGGLTAGLLIATQHHGNSTPVIPFISR